MRNPIDLHRNDGSTYTLTYFDKVVGHVGKIGTKHTAHKWRAVSVHGHLQYCYTLGEARKWLMTMYH
jgi:hypothetical protein